MKEGIVVLDFPREIEISPHIFEVIDLLFKWANNRGLEGKKCDSLRFYFPSVVDAFDGSMKLICDVYEQV